MADTPAGQPLERTLSFRLHLVNKLADKSSADAYAHEFGLPIGQARCLAAIGGFAPLSVIGLAAKSNLDKAQASRASQALADRGLVARRPSDSDARSVVLSLTPRGRKLWTAVMALIAQRNNEIFGCLTPAERKELGRMLDRLIEDARLNTHEAGPLRP